MQSSARDPAVTQLRMQTETCFVARARQGTPAPVCSCAGRIPAWVQGKLLKRQKDQSEHFSFLIQSDPEKLASGEILVVHFKI